MIAFFDTNIYIDYLRGVMPAQIYVRYFHTYIIRLCPIVYHELLRGIRTPKVAKLVTQLTEEVLFLPAPTTAMWTQAGQLMSAWRPARGGKTWEEMQNDVLIALTARHTGTTLITRDADFKKLQRQLDLAVIYHPTDS